jgi:hypothetical protein
VKAPCGQLENGWRKGWTYRAVHIVMVEVLKHGVRARLVQSDTHAPPTKRAKKAILCGKRSDSRRVRCSGAEQEAQGERRTPSGPEC